MSWARDNWLPLTVVGGVLGVSWYAGKSADENIINGMTLDEWLDEIDRIKATKEPFYYSNNILGTPKYGNGIDSFWEQGWSPQGILSVWRMYEGEPAQAYFEKMKAWKKMRSDSFATEDGAGLMRNWTFLWQGYQNGGNSVIATSLEDAKRKVITEWGDPTDLTRKLKPNLSTLSDDPVVNKRRSDDWDSMWRSDSFAAEGEGEGHDCSMCGRPYDMNRIGLGLIEYYLKESNYATLGWKSKDNPDGVAKTARNMAGSELFLHGDGAIEHYMIEGKRSKIFDKTIVLLRASIVPQIIAGDVMNFIELLEIDDVDSDPKFEEDFGGKWSAEIFNEEHEDHDEIDELIEDLDKLTGFCISFLHDGAYGGESQGREIIGEDLEEEKVWYVEGSIELKFVYEEGVNTFIRASYTNETDGPVIYLPPAKVIKTQPDDERSVQ